jgi:SAM-dependent methyltransferase
MDSWRCEFCSSPGDAIYDVFLGERRGEMYRCSKCLSCQIKTPFAASDLEEFYRTSYFSQQPWELNKARILAADYLGKVAPFMVPSEGPALEVGAGYGFFAARLPAKLSCRVDVVEPSRSCREFITAQPGAPGTCSVPTIAELPPRQTYQNTFAFHVVEHFQRLSPFLDEIAPRLSPGGRLLILTPNASSRSFAIYGATWGSACINQHYEFLSTRMPPEFFLQFGLRVVTCQDVAPAPIHYPSAIQARMHRFRDRKGARRGPLAKLVSKTITAAALPLSQNREGLSLLPIERFLASGRTPKDELLLVLEKVTK